MTATTEGTKLTCRSLSAADGERLRHVFDLCRYIFDPNNEGTDAERPSNQLHVWRERLSESGSTLLYATNASNAERPLGFFFIVSRTAPEIGHELPHISVAGVEQASRGLGIFPFLLAEAVQHARQKGHTELTVCTYPARFVKMYRILTQHGWQEVAWREGGEKVLMKLKI